MAIALLKTLTLYRYSGTVMALVIGTFAIEMILQGIEVWLEQRPAGSGSLINLIRIRQRHQF